MSAATMSECINFFELQNYRAFTKLFLRLFKTQRSLQYQARKQLLLSYGVLY